MTTLTARARKALVCVMAGVGMMSAAPVAAVQTPVTFNLINLGGAAPDSAAGKGFSLAARYWSSVLTTSQPITVNFQVSLAALGPDILGSTRSSYTARAVVDVQDLIVAGQYGGFDASLQLPTLQPGMFGNGSALEMYTPGYTGIDPVNGPYGIDNATKVFDTDGGFNNSVIGLTVANARAIGYTFAPGTVDASIQFSSQFPFDFNPLDGITPGKYDFVAVAIHEMGHALGFVSGVDDYDVLGTGGPLEGVDCGGFECQDYPANDDWFGQTLDLFRYSAPGALDWTTNTASYFSIDGGATAFGNGKFSTGNYTGDGWQASHWKAPQLPNGNFSCAMPKLGIMNPYICGGRLGVVTGLDLASLDAIGWNINGGNPGLAYGKTTSDIVHGLFNVPEPAVWLQFMMGFGLLGTAARRRLPTFAA
jgi:hypothetical protein